MSDIDKKIEEVERAMAAADFWTNKEAAQRVVEEYQKLKDEKEGLGQYDRGNAIVTIFSGAGGDDAEDFSYMLFNMYTKYFSKKGWSYETLHSNTNDHGGYRNVTMEVSGKNVYGTLKNESGVHRLVRISPFNSKSQRHTSFSMVEVVPVFEKLADLEIPEDDIEVELSKSSGPGGQNVNKRETAVRVVHTPTGLASHSDGQRSQAQNKEKALQLLTGKLFRLMEKERKEKISDLSISSSTQIEWGNQIRSYVLHPYKMVKDHRTDMEVRDVEGVLDGDLDAFIEAEKGL